MERKYKVAVYLNLWRNYTRSIFVGFCKYARTKHDWIIVNVGDYVYKNDSKLSIDLLKENNFDAVIMLEQDNQIEFEKLKIPMIVLNTYSKKIPHAINLKCDNFAVGKMMAEHLESLNLEHFAFYGLKDAVWSTEKRDGFEKYLKRKIHFFDFENDNAIHGHKELYSWIEKLPKPIGIACAIDELASKVVETCILNNIKVPQDVAIVGGDNDELISESSYCSISSIALNGENSGYQSAKLLDDCFRLKKRLQKDVLIHPIRLEKRFSSDILMVEDDKMKQVWQYIEENPEKNLSIETLAKHIGISRRSLDRRFFNAFNMTLLEKISRIKIDRIKYYLENTDMRISEISERLGFENASHFARYFSRGAGMTPSRYRNLMS